MSMPSVQPTNQQKEEVTKPPDKDDEEAKEFELWKKRFHELWRTLLCRFSVTLHVKGYKPDDVELVIDTNGKLNIKGRKVVEQTEDEIYYEEFNETLDLPKDIDDDEISVDLNENGHLVITAPRLIEGQLQNTNTERKVETPCEKVKGFSVKLNVKGYEPSNVQLLIDPDGKLDIKGRKEIERTDDEIYFKEFHEILDLPDDIDDENIRVTQDEKGYLVIFAPLSSQSQGSEVSDTKSNTPEPEEEIKEVFLVKINTNYYQPRDIQLDVETDSKLNIRGHKGDGVIRFDETLDLPNNIDNDGIRVDQDENGCFVIKAPLLWNMQECNVSGRITTVPQSNEQRKEVFLVKMNTNDYKPGDIELSVKTTHKLNIKGRKEIQTEDGIHYDGFDEKLDLPDNIDNSKIRVDQDENGFLVIKAPLRLEEPTSHGTGPKEDVQKDTDSTPSFSESTRKHSNYWDDIVKKVFASSEKIL